MHFFNTFQSSKAPLDKYQFGLSHNKSEAAYTIIFYMCLMIYVDIIVFIDVIVVFVTVIVIIDPCLYALIYKTTGNLMDL